MIHWQLAIWVTCVASSGKPCWRRMPKRPLRFRGLGTLMRNRALTRGVARPTLEPISRSDVTVDPPNSRVVPSADPMPRGRRVKAMKNSHLGQFCGDSAGDPRMRSDIDPRCICPCLQKRLSHPESKSVPSVPLVPAVVSAEYDERRTNG